MFQILDPNVQMIQGVPKGIADAIILLGARKIQRSRNQMTAAGTPHQASYYAWKGYLRDRVKLRLHLVRKDIQRRADEAEARAQGLTPPTPVVGAPAPSHGFENDEEAEEFWKTWNLNNENDWQELHDLTQTKFLSQHAMKEPKPRHSGRTPQERKERKRNEMAADPDFAEKEKEKPEEKAAEREPQEEGRIA